MTRTWKEITAANPDHSHHYAQRWQRIAASGDDIFGEARLIDAMAPRHSRILDAGCGTGRIGGWLSTRDHDVYGVDIDPILVDYAKHDYPNVEWKIGNLATTNLPQNLDIIVCAGNVLTFIDPADRVAVLENLCQALGDTGRLICGFGAGRGWDFSNYLEQVQQSGFTVDALFSTWDLRPFDSASDFLVSVMSKKQ